MCYCLWVREAQRKLEELEERRRAKKEGEDDVVGGSDSVSNKGKDDKEDVSDEGVNSDVGEENKADRREGGEMDNKEEEEEEEGREEDVEIDGEKKEKKKEKEEKEEGVDIDSEEKEEKENEKVCWLKNCCELVLFNNKQKRLLKKI